MSLTKLFSALLFLSLACSAAPAATPTIVQTAFNSGFTSPGVGMVFGSTPTVNNLVFCWMYTSSNSFSSNTPTYTQFDKNGLGADTQLTIFYRYVQSGDTTTIAPLTTSGSPYWNSTCAEIAGVSTTFANVVEQTDSVNPNSVNTLTTNSVTTTHTNDLAVISIANYDSVSNFSGGSGFTYAVNTLQASNYGAWALLYAPFAASGSTFSTSFTVPTGSSHQSAYYTLVLRAGSTPPSGKILFHSFP